MMNHKIFSVLKTFTKKEFNSFLSFMKSPYFNNWNVAGKLLEELKPFHPEFDDEKLTGKDLYERIYPGKSYNDSTMRNLYAELVYAADDFLAYEKFRLDNDRKELYTLKSLAERNLEKCYRRKLETANLHMLEKGETDSERFYMMHELELNIADFKISCDRTVHINMLPERINVMEAGAIYLTLSYFVKLIELLHRMWVYEEKYRVQLDKEVIKDIIGLIDIKKLEELIKLRSKHGYIIELYLSLMKILSDTKDIKKYFEYKGHVLGNIEKMTDYEREFHYSNLINYCNLEHHLTSSEFDFKEELFELYEEMLLKEYYRNSNNTYLDVSLFRAILLLVLNLGKFDWAENFVSTYSKHAHPKHIENMYNYGAAMLAAERHEHHQAMEFASKIQLDCFIFKYDLSILKLKVYYEYRNEGPAFFLVNAFTQFLKADKFMKRENKEYYLNFVKCYNKLLHPSKLKRDIEYYRAKVVKERKIACRDWLLECYDRIAGEGTGNRKLKNQLSV